MACLLALLFSFHTMQGQQKIPEDPLQNVPSSIELRPLPGETDPGEAQRVRLERDMAKKANLERQATIKRDTASLLKLATELQAYVDKSNESILSLDVVKKAEEIEKLAHTVKEKMKGP